MIELFHLPDGLEFVLWNYTGLILPLECHPPHKDNTLCPTIFLSQQTGGFCCLQHKVRGVFLPVPLDESTSTTLSEHFTDEKYGGWCDSGIDEDTADFLDNLFTSVQANFRIQVNRDRLEECEEAWIHVVLSGLNGSTGTIQAVFTWPNSD